MARFPLRALSSCALFLPAILGTPALAQSSPHFLPAGTPSDLVRVEANDNTVPAGVTRDGVREISLEVVRADWRVEAPDGPGLRVAAIAEVGGAPMIPGPLLRVESGTRLAVRVRNGLSDAPITVFGLYRRPASSPDSLLIAPGAEARVEFEAGEPGTYIYRVREEGVPGPEGEESAEREQLAGAFVVDPAGGAPPDRILVVNIFSEPVDTTISGSGWIEALTINGKSWPFTERFAPSVGEIVRWRVVNASDRFHPMHLHGFYYNVLSRGTETRDTIYAPENRRLVVTEPMRAGTTMLGVDALAAGALALPLPPVVPRGPAHPAARRPHRSRQRCRPRRRQGPHGGARGRY